MTKMVPISYDYQRTCRNALKEETMEYFLCHWMSLSELGARFCKLCLIFPVLNCVRLDCYGLEEDVHY